MEPIYSKADEKLINKNIIENQQTNIQEVSVPTFRQEVVENIPVNVSRNNQIAEHREAEINQNAQAVRERKRILAELEEKQNSKRLGDSALMKKIKAAAVDIEDMLEMSVPLNQEKLDIAISALEIRYDTLISYCDKYEKINAGKNSGTAGARLGFVKELRIVTELEKKNIKAAAEHIKGEHQDKNELTNWKEIVLRARSEEDINEGRDYNLRDRQEVMDSAVALSKIAEYMGASDVFLKREYVKVGNKVMLRSPKMDTDNYKTLEELTTSEAKAKKRYSLNAFKKLQALQTIEDLLGLKFKADDIYLKYNIVTKVINSKDIKYAEIDDLIVRTPIYPKLVREMSKESKQSGIIIDRTMANRVIGMDPDMLSLLMTGLIDSSQRSTLKNNLKNMKKRFHMKDSRVVGDKDWINSGETLLRARRKEAEKNEMPRWATESMLYQCSGGLHYGNLKRIHVRFEAKQEDEQQKKQEADAIMLWYAEERANAINKRIDKLKDMEPQERAKELEAEKEQHEKNINTCNLADDIILTTAEIGYSLRRKSNAPMPTFTLRDRSKELIFTKVPSPEDVKQGSVGNCYLMSALSALAKNNPQLIMSMIEDKGDYALVKFPKHTPIPVSKKSVMITRPGEEAKDYYSGGALWVQLIEKAYGRLHYEKKKDDKEDLLKLSRKYVNRMGIEQSTEKEKQEVHFLLKYSVEITSGGNVADALTNLTGQKYEKKKLDIITVDNMDIVYSNMWNKAQAGDEQKGIDGFSEEEMYLRSVIEKPLKKELVRRFSKTYLNSMKKVTTNAFRNLTIENIKDTILDIKNWTYDKKDMNYIKLYKDVKDKFHSNDENFSDARFMAILSFMAKKLEVSNDGLKESFEHETVGIQRTRYTRRAQNIAAFIEAALKHGVLTTGTRKYIDGKGDGLNSEHTVEGMIEGHAYTIYDYRELKSTGQIMLSLRNPWGEGGMEYVQTCDANGNIITTGRGTKVSGDDGSFEIELNDFLRFFVHISAAENVLNEAEVNSLYQKI